LIDHKRYVIQAMAFGYERKGFLCSKSVSRF